MGCLLPLIGLICPRFLMIFIYFLTTWFSQAYETHIWPFLGFLFMPFTTLAYMATMLNNNHVVNGPWLALIVVAAIVDLGAGGSTATQQQGLRRNFRNGNGSRVRR